MEPLTTALTVAQLVAMLAGLFGGKKSTETRTAEDPRYKSPSLGVLDPALFQGVLGNLQRSQNLGFPSTAKIGAGQTGRISDVLGSLQDQWPDLIKQWETGEDKYGKQPGKACSRSLSQDTCNPSETGTRCVDGRCVPFKKLDDGTIVYETDPRYKSPTLGVLDPLLLGGMLESYGRYENFGYPTEGKGTALMEGGYIRQILDSLQKQWPEIMKNWEEGIDDENGDCVNDGDCQAGETCINGDCIAKSKICDPPCKYPLTCVDNECVGPDDNGGNGGGNKGHGDDCTPHSNECGPGLKCGSSGKCHSI